jgi:hypothetical protein
MRQLPVLIVSMARIEEGMKVDAVEIVREMRQDL